MSSSEILLKNLKCHYKVNSVRSLAGRLNYSQDIVLNWSSGRSSPNIEQIDDIAYRLCVEVSQLLIENNKFTIETPVWKDNIEITLRNNLGRLRLEKDIDKSFFNEDTTDKYGMSYRAFSRNVNRQNKQINLSTLDRLAAILSVEPFELLESEMRK